MNSAWQAGVCRAGVFLPPAIAGLIRVAGGCRARVSTGSLGEAAEVALATGLRGWRGQPRER